MNTPCMNCEKAGCGAYHDKCERYKAWKEQEIAMRQDEKKERKRTSDGSYGAFRYTGYRPGGKF